MKKRFVIPTLVSAWVGCVGTLLLSIGARSPYTHSNYQLAYDAGYARTEQILVGPPVPYAGLGLASPPPPGADLTVRGRELMVSDGCATCHGMEGRGGPVGKPIVGTSAADLRKKTTKGPGGMPAFAHEALPDDDLNAIAAYLKSLQK